MKFLKFTSEVAAIEALAPWAAYLGTVAVDVVCVIHRPTGNTLTDSGGNSYPDMQPIPGWHINLSGEVPELATFEIDAPDTPVRTFAGAL